MTGGPEKAVNRALVTGGNTNVLAPGELFKERVPSGRHLTQIGNAVEFDARIRKARKDSLFDLFGNHLRECAVTVKNVRRFVHRLLSPVVRQGTQIENGAGGFRSLP